MLLTSLDSEASWTDQHIEETSTVVTVLQTSEGVEALISGPVT